MINLLLPNSLRDTQHLSEMHQLRYIRFVQDLGWTEGLKAVSQMEFDCFDHDQAFYIVHTDNDNKVDALARLTQTLYPNLLLDAFGDNIDDISKVERSSSVLEISRFCSNQKTAPRNVMGQIIAGLLQIGLAYDIKYYVSFSNIHIKPRAQRFGWAPEELGSVLQIGNEQAIALKHDVSSKHYEEVLKRLNSGPVLNIKEMERCPINTLRMAM